MNQATRLNVAVLGTIFGVSGMSHGFFETLQGNVPTGGTYIFAIGEAQKMWPHGNEPAFTLIPNFLLTGIAAMMVGLALLVWSLGFVHKKHGPTVILLLFMLLLLVGGGVAQLLFFPWLWLVSTRIHQPLDWWRKVLPVRLQQAFAALWPWVLVLSAGLLAFALFLATTGFVPTVNDPEAVLSMMLFCLGMEVILFPLTFIAGFAHDILARSPLARKPTLKSRNASASPR
jgi:hypothetical protein